MTRFLALAALPLAAITLWTPSSAQDTPETPDEAIASAPAQDWELIALDDLLVMDLAPDQNGKARQVIIQLMPAPFSQGWVENIRTMARSHWWDGTSVYRVVDNWVTQWGDVSEEKPLPEGLKEVPESAYLTLQPTNIGHYVWGQSGQKEAKREVKAIVSRNGQNPPPAPPHFSDPYGEDYGFTEGMPVQVLIRAETEPLYPPREAPHAAWPIHCYGSVGVARNLSPDTGTGSELYAVIGHAPRQLDRNIAVVGRVVEGMANLSSLPRGTGEAGVYTSREEDTPILSVRLASDLPEADQPHLEYLDTDSSSFATYTYLKANRNDQFYRVPAGGVDICNVPVPVRRTPKK